jgi:hypothetical protein
VALNTITLTLILMRRHRGLEFLVNDELKECVAVIRTASKSKYKITCMSEKN